MNADALHCMRRCAYSITVTYINHAHMRMPCCFPFCMVHAQMRMLTQTGARSHTCKQNNKGTGHRVGSQSTACGSGHMGLPHRLVTIVRQPTRFSAAKQCRASHCSCADAHEPSLMRICACQVHTPIVTVHIVLVTTQPQKIWPLTGGSFLTSGGGTPSPDGGQDGRARPVFPTTGNCPSDAEN